uniref:Uncharacterized protein n=1 Tax=Glossina pallidipes TaxID=7398 RepID=A0A1B0A8E5_GLOPL
MKGWEVMITTLQNSMLTLVTTSNGSVVMYYLKSNDNSGLKSSFSLFYELINSIIFGYLQNAINFMLCRRSSIKHCAAVDLEDLQPGSDKKYWGLRLKFLIMISVANMGRSILNISCLALQIFGKRDDHSNND